MFLKSIEGLVGRLFEERWALLDKPALQNEALAKPGVYILAYPDRTTKLLGKKTKAKDIYYIGMTNSKAGLRGRLKDFLRAIECGRGHSGGDRFFKLHQNRPYSKHKPKRPIYFVTHLVNCCAIKAQSQPKDFRAMGHVACLEYYAIAYVKEKTGHVPTLNLSAGGKIE
jgi:hypothetical protein